MAHPKQHLLSLISNESKRKAKYILLLDNVMPFTFNAWLWAGEKKNDKIRSM